MSERKEKTSEDAKAEQRERQRRSREERAAQDNAAFALRMQTQAVEETRVGNAARKRKQRAAAQNSEVATEPPRGLRVKNRRLKRTKNRNQVVRMKIRPPPSLPLPPLPSNGAPNGTYQKEVPVSGPVGGGENKLVRGKITLGTSLQPLKRACFLDEK